jgi:hypothetical protein
LPSDQQIQSSPATARTAQPPRAVPEPTARPAEPVIRAVEPALPGTAAFLSGAETRLRDLLAFALAAEGGKPVGPGDVAALRQKAEAELEAYAFRTLHNRVEAIRLEAMQEQVARLRGGPGLIRLVFANLVALLIAAGLGFAAWRYQADLLALLNGA